MGVAEIGRMAVNWIDLAKDGNKRRGRNELSISKVLGISSLAEELLASEEELCSVEFVSCVVNKCGGYHMACVSGWAECGSLLLKTVIRPRTAYLFIYHSTEPKDSADIFLSHLCGRLIPKFCRGLDFLPICIDLRKSF